MREKVRVSERAVLQRINRVLARDGEKLKKARETYLHTLGRFYILDQDHDFVIKKDVDLEALAREKHVLAKWEVLEQGRER